MDAERFDLLLRSFAAVASRRHAVRFLASAALDGLLSLRPLSTEAARRAAREGQQQEGSDRARRAVPDKKAGEAGEVSRAPSAIKKGPLQVQGQVLPL